MQVTSYVPIGLNHPCWHWTGAHDAQGRPRVKHNGANEHVRRLIANDAPGRLQPSEHVVALCRDPRCINPAHLVVCTADEAREFRRQGRIGVGDLCMIKQLMREGEATLTYAAEAYSISERLLADCLRRCRDFDGRP